MPKGENRRCQIHGASARLVLSQGVLRGASCTSWMWACLQASAGSEWAFMEMSVVSHI